MCIKVQGKYVGLSNVFVSLIRFSDLVYDIELIFSMNDNISLVYSLRSCKKSRHDCTPPFNCINEYRSNSNYRCSDVDVSSNLFDNCKSLRTSSFKIASYTVK